MNTTTETYAAVVLLLVIVGVAALAIFSPPARRIMARALAASLRYLGRRMRGVLRTVLIYRRDWYAGMTNLSLTGHHVVKVKNPTTGKRERKTETAYPEIRRMVSSKTTDRFRIVMLPGQTITEWAPKSEALAVLYGADQCRIRTLRPARITLSRKRRRTLDVTMLRRDPLRKAVMAWPLPTAPSSIDFKRLPVATDENGDAFYLRLLGTHLLIVGATGAGKGSAIWSPIEQLAPAIGAGLVRLLGIDPKALELAMGERLFDETVIGSDGEAMAALLEKGVGIMNDRKTRMSGKSRLHTPTVAEPLWVIVIDEVLALTSAVKDRKIKDRIEQAFTLLLSQGRALGISLVLASQDPRKDGMPWRGLVPTKCLLRVNEAADVDMVMGAGARARGALADQIEDCDDTPGTAYMWGEGIREPQRIRFPYVSDDRLRELQDRYGRPAPTLELVKDAS